MLHSMILWDRVILYKIKDRGYKNGVVTILLVTYRLHYYCHLGIPGLASLNCCITEIVTSLQQLWNSLWLLIEEIQVYQKLIVLDKINMRFKFTSK